MRIVTEEAGWFLEQAKIIHKEIVDDIGVNEYWHPKIDEERWPSDVPKHQVFEQAYMKFLNGNLNYYHFPNMVLHSQEQDGWNESFPAAINFCKTVRQITQNKGPLGRMCVWDLPPGRKLLPHVDDFEYHRHIVRNIFIVSPNMEDKVKINISGQAAPVKQGSFFQFQPHKEMHEFVNDSDEHFYFLGFDYWIMDRLNEAMARTNLEGVKRDPERLKRIGDTFVYGSMNTRCKYQSKHGIDLSKNVITYE